MTLPRFSIRRFWAMVLKEFVQMRRDRMTFGMMIGVPVMQLVLFGFAINADPKHLPTAIHCADTGAFARTLVWALRTTDYFRVVAELPTEAAARRVLDTGEVQFVLTIPVDFSRRLLRGERPAVLLEADATDPVATGNAIGAVNEVVTHALDRDLKDGLERLRARPGPVELRVHRRYNPEGLTRYNIVPGLMGVVLTMTMVMITAVAVTRERERGTMENLLSTPIRPFEVILGKIIPYVAVGYIQITLILLMAWLVFGVPMIGNVLLLYAAALIFIGANLSVGITFSTVARNQLQAVQSSFFFFLPSLLLSGFMFPFRGMPDWAQAIGSVLPLTHFLRIVRGILLKGNALPDILPHLWPLALFMVGAMIVGVSRYRRTLD